MKENLKFQWENQAKRLMEDGVFAKKFAEVILEDVLEERVKVEELFVRTQKGGMSGGAVIRLDAAIREKCGVQRRNMEICLYQEEGIQKHHKSFGLQYYCVEAPAILLDSGSTRVNLAVREDILSWWKETEKRSL